MKLFKSCIYIIIPIHVFAQGHGLCNNSGGYRQIFHYAEKYPELIEDSPDLLNKLRRDEELNATDLESFKNVYQVMCIENAQQLDLLTNTSLIDASQLSSPALQTRNNALAFDISIGLGQPMDTSVALTRTPLDQQTNLRTFSLQHEYPADYKTFIDLLRQNAPNLRFNGNTLPNHVLTFFRENLFSETSIPELQTLLSNSFSHEELIHIAKPKTLSMTFSILSDLHIGDSAIINYNATFVTLDDTRLFNRYSLYMQKISEDKFVLFNPLSSRLNSFGEATSIITQSEGAQAFAKTLFQDQEHLFDYIQELIKTAVDKQNPFLFDLSNQIMSQEYGAQSLLYLSDILLSDFNIITHSPPPAL